MVPSCRSPQHGRPVLGRLRRPHRAPTSTLLCRPPTPCPLPPPLRFPLLMADLAAGAWFYAPRGRRHVRPPRAGRRRRGTGSPARRDGSRRGEGLPGYGTVLFVRALVEHPAGDPSLLAQKIRMPGGVMAFRYNRPLGLRADSRFRGRLPHGPHVRTPPHRRPHCWDRRKAGYRLRRAHPWPGGFCTRWTINEVSCRYRIFTPLRPALPGRTIFLILGEGAEVAYYLAQKGRRRCHEPLYGLSP